MGSSGAVLALDVGTSSCRASLYDVAGRRIRGRAAQVAYSPAVTADGGAELDADQLFEHLATAIDGALANPKTPPIVAVGMATFWHSLLGVDFDGRPLTPVYLWLDARSREDAARLRGLLDQAVVHARTGCMLHWSYWPAKLAWAQRTQQKVASRVARWVSFGEFALQRLTGEAGLSLSMASATGLLDQHTLQWDPEVLSAIDLSPDKLSPISGSRAEAAQGLQIGGGRATVGRNQASGGSGAATVGSNQASGRSGAATAGGVRASLGGGGGAVLREVFAVRWPALRNVPWLPAWGDGACSNIGSGCTSPERFALMIGTSGAERAVWAPGAAFDIPAGAWCYRVDSRRLVIGGALNDGGSLLDWLRRSFKLPAAERAEAELATLEPDAHGLTVLPFWGGERSPGWADDARGAVIGLRLHTRPVDILRAALEAVALRFAAIDRRLQAALPTSHEVIATGGALLRSPAWMQILADALGRPVLASLEPEASSRGAALLTLEAVGCLEQPLESQAPPTGHRFEPIAAHTERYRAAAERQQRLYDALL